MNCDTISGPRTPPPTTITVPFGGPTLGEPDELCVALVHEADAARSTAANEDRVATEKYVIGSLVWRCSGTTSRQAEPLPGLSTPVEHQSKLSSVCIQRCILQRLFPDTLNPLVDGVMKTFRLP
jgi:hypothetical protein